MLMSTLKPLSELENSSEFIARHIGISAEDEAMMLSVIGEASRRALIESIVADGDADGDDERFDDHDVDGTAEESRDE